MQTMDTRPADAAPRLAWHAMVGAMLCFASVPVFIKYFAGFLDAWTVNAVRYATAALFWLPYLLWVRHTEAPDRLPWREALIPAAINTLGQIGWALSPYFNDASFIGFVTRSSFLLTTLAGFFLLPQERGLLKHPLFWIGTACIVAGLAGLYAGGIRRGGTSPLGMVILLGTAACWGFYGVSVRRCVSGFGVRVSFAIISLYTTLVLIGLMFCFGHWRSLRGVAPHQWGWLVLSGFVGIAFSHVLLYRTIHSFGAIATDGVMSLQPFLVALSAMWVLNERLSAGQWIGGIAIALGCLALVRARLRAGAVPMEAP